MQKTQEYPITEKFLPVAEFERHDSIWVSWSEKSYFSGNPTGFVVVELIKHLLHFIDVVIIVNSENEKSHVQTLISKKLPGKHNVTYIISPNSKWIRDKGPMFLRNHRGQKQLLRFDHYNFRLRNAKTHNENIKLMNINIGRHLNLPIASTDLISDGGNREFNGKGVLIAIEETELEKNPWLRRDQLERELLRVTGQYKIIWLQAALIENESLQVTKRAHPDDIFTIGPSHVDQMCRFVGTRTILLAEIPSDEKELNSVYRASHKRLEHNFQILKNESDQDSKPFYINRVPVPYPLITKVKVNAKSFFRGFHHYSRGTVHEGDLIKLLLPASYLNFVIGNDVVIVPSYWKENRPIVIKERDEKVRSIFNRVFPTRKIVQLNPEDLHYGGGGFHCITMHQPQ